MTGRIRGVSLNSYQGRQSAIALEKDSNGIHWSISADHIEYQQTAVDCHRLRKDQVAKVIVFYANPLIHGFPWSVPDTLANKHVLVALKKQPFRWYKGSNSTLARTLETLRLSAEGSAWIQQLYSRRQLNSKIMGPSLPRNKLGSGIEWHCGN